MKVRKMFIMVAVICCSQFLRAAEQDTLINNQEHIAHYFDSGELSALIPVLDNTKGVFWGEVRAFNRLGEVIYTNEIRIVAGLATIEFTYFETGGVKTAHYRSRPDGGIQQTDVKVPFDQNVQLVRRVDLSTDMMRKPAILGLTH